MTVLQRICEPFISSVLESRNVTPAPESNYEVRILNDISLNEVWRLNQRCFKIGENYDRDTFIYLLSQPNILSYQVITTNDEMAGFVFVTVMDDGTAHLTTIGIAPEHRRRGLAKQLLHHIENALRLRQISVICLEVRIDNLSAQQLYLKTNYSVIQRLTRYYKNGEDGFLMVKSLV